jgi:hypothetical protein
LARATLTSPYVQPVILQTLRVPLSAFASQGVNTADLREIAILTDVNPAGTLYLDDIQLSY